MKIGFCETSGTLRTFYILGILKNILFIIVPIILILLGAFRLTQAIIKKDEKMHSIIKQSIINLAIGLVIFFLPILTMSILSIANKETVDYLKGCFRSSTPTKAEYMSKVEDVENSLVMLKGKPSKENLIKTEDKLKSLVIFMNGEANRADREIIENFHLDLADHYTIVEEKELEKDCLSKGGIFEKNKCVIKEANKPTVKEEITEESNDNGVAVDGNAGKMIPYTFKSSNDYLVINSKISINEYLKIIDKNEIRQKTRSKEHRGYCLAVSYVHAHNLHFGGKNDNTRSFLGYKYAYKYSSHKEYSKSEMLKAIYKELTNNRPIIIQVNGNKQGTSRHFVTAVGFKKSVTSSSSLSQGDILIIDSWDGKLEGLKPVGDRFFITGRDCNKNYSGHYALTLK
ncbi:MAG: hypothetical protein GX951_00685 [Mollicutes bacterium]|nr:hypothetical protein [Mollicutes bacterium]